MSTANINIFILTIHINKNTSMPSQQILDIKGVVLIFYQYKLFQTDDLIIIVFQV